jgi:hypothetical protein
MDIKELKELMENGRMTKDEVRAMAKAEVEKKTDAAMESIGRGLVYGVMLGIGLMFLGLSSVLFAYAWSLVK